MSLKRIVNLDQFEEKQKKEVPEARIETKKTNELKKEIPPNELFGMSLKKIDGYRDLRVNMKQNNELLEFINGFDNILQIFDVNDKHFDSKIVQFVAQSAEWFFVRKKCGELKEKAVIEVVKKYFNHDELLVKTIIKLVFPLIKKCSIYRRYKKKVSNFFLPLLNMAGLSYNPIALKN